MGFGISASVKLSPLIALCVALLEMVLIEEFFRLLVKLAETLSVVVVFVV